MTANDELIAGWRAHQQGRLAEAEQAYRRVLAARPADVHALNLLGLACLDQGRAAEAVGWIEAALRIDDSDAEAHANLGLACKDAGRLADAAAAFGRALEIAPEHAATLTHRGNVLVDLGRTEEAIAHYRAALKVEPDHQGALVNLAPALQSRGQTEGALAAAVRAVQLQPRGPVARRVLAEVLAAQHRHEEAAACFRDALTLDADDADARVGLSGSLKELGEAAAAEAMLRDALARQPHHAQAHTSLGVLLEQQGDAAAAAAAFRAAIASSPRHALAHYQLAQLKGAAMSPAEVAATQALFDEPNLTDAQRAPLAFALACIHERAGDVERTFGHLAIGHAIKARENPYRDAEVADHHRRIEAVFAAWPVADRSGEAAWPQPLFVVGMPRSGTTLTEQILSSHPEVAGAGEMGLMEDTVAEAARITGKPYPECVPLLSAEQCAALGERYRKALLQRATAARYVVDKTPMNFQYIGFIDAILPAAPIVHCRREPMDNAWSIFKLPFESAHAYAHDLAALGHYYRRYAALMATWHRVRPGRVIDVGYEALVADFDAQLSRLARCLALSDDPAMRRFHQTRRLVKTPSASQVRRPIYRDSVAAWKRYEAHLQPLQAALQSPLDG